ncbi:sulfatase [Carboxylicivirga sp. M1479]|uniref:sulfatase family protein n=1 Tax=Carboxylicivirga sp. M1479 TaxID=2594476 RepID=UPI0011777AE4|nr:sulfatase [Carboxylicivirga sp. M1479]TRX70214.1 sulfatase [Carboxylicivirga sp. M1479]
MLKFSRVLFSLIALFSLNACNIELDNQSSETKQPNILWIYVEDLSPDFACYGNSIVNTPNVDALAKQGIMYTNMHMPAAVCSAVRSGIITGLMPTTIGLHNHHSSRDLASAIFLPDSIKTIPEIFKEHGYYTFNHGKDDYNFWYERRNLYSGAFRSIGMYGMQGLKNDWKARKEGQPFFGQIQLYGNKHIYNSKFKSKVIRPIDPAKIEVPPYYPDSAFVRQDMADHLECIELTDREVGDIITRLKEDGLLENTYIFFFSDHGMRLWRHKQFLYDAGTKVPFVLAYYGNNGVLQKGTVNNDLMSGLDIGTTTLGLANIDIPNYTEGQDFLSDNYQARDHVISVRDRCDFTIDRIRSIRTKQFRYIRNYFPDRPYMQPNYRDEWIITQRMRYLSNAGQLNSSAASFWSEERPSEELYDVNADPHQINNLANNPDYAIQLNELRTRLEEWVLSTDDKGQYPEGDAGLKFMYQRWSEQCVNPEYDKFK